MAAHTYTQLRAHRSMVLAEFERLDSFGMAKATHPSALCLSNVVTPQCACACLENIHT